MSFKKDKFCVIKKAVSKELVEFLFLNLLRDCRISI